jgi:hypothetical protein
MDGELVLAWIYLTDTLFFEGKISLLSIHMLEKLSGVYKSIV